MEVPSLKGPRALANKALGLRSGLEQQLSFVEKEIKELTYREDLLLQVTNLIRHLIDIEVTRGVSAVEELQTEGLREIFFDQDLKVRAEVGVSRGKVAVTFLTSQGREDGSVVEASGGDAFGGSIATMQSVLMRITVIFRRKMRPLLILDETLAAVADRYVERAAKFLSVLAKRLDLDVLLVSHDDALVGAAQCAYSVQKVQDHAVFKKIT